MFAPFGEAAFFDAFARYNEGVWPAQIALVGVAVLAIWFVASGLGADRLVAMLLAWLWLWMAIAYHAMYFTAVTPAAWLFAALFAAEGLMLLWDGVLHRRVAFVVPTEFGRRSAGLWMFVYGLALYPALGLLLGHVPPRAPTFGVPCPTTLFTFGILLWTTETLPRRLLVVPAIWSLLGMTAALQFGMLEDVALPVAAALAIGITAVHPRRSAPPLSGARAR